MTFLLLKTLPRALANSVRGVGEGKCHRPSHHRKNWRRCSTPLTRWCRCWPSYPRYAPRRWHPLAQARSQRLQAGPPLTGW